MTLHVFPDPRVDVQSLLEAGASYWPTATIDTSFPDAELATPHIQHAWDGTPAQQVNRQTAAIRVTCWQPRGKVSDSITLAQLVRAYLLDAGAANTWRFTPGAGPSHGADPDADLPFCTFTLNAETRPSAVD